MMANVKWVYLTLSLRDLLTLRIHNFVFVSLLKFYNCPKSLKFSICNVKNIYKKTDVGGTSTELFYLKIKGQLSILLAVISDGNLR